MSVFEIGQRILVRQRGSSSWVSRIIEFQYEGMYQIAIPVRHERGNLCNGSWPYTSDTLTLLTDDVDDWAIDSDYITNDRVMFLLNQDTPQYKYGTELEGILVSPHIEKGDWFVKFLTPADKQFPNGWWFTMVINECSFMDRIEDAVEDPTYYDWHKADY